MAETACDPLWDDGLVAPQETPSVSGGGPARPPTRTARGLGQSGQSSKSYPASSFQSPREL